MKKIQDCFKIKSVNILHDGCFDFVIECPEVAQLVAPGMFVNVLCGEKTLRRPISVCDFNKSNGSLRIVFEVRGEGTLWLSKLQAGDSIDLLGPLGNGFPQDLTGKKIMLVGGGIGVPPLLSVAKSGACDAILGFRNKSAAILLDEFKAECGELSVATDDGSLGTKGFVTDLLGAALQTGDYDAVFACGPTPMLKAVSALSERNGTKCFVSMEERMGCGIGACLVCACKTKKDGKEGYSHVCKNGPVFDSTEVCW